MKPAVRYAPLIMAIALLFQAAFGAAPEYAGEAAIVLNGDVPDIDFLFTGEEYISYEPLDQWLRPTRAVACLGPETLSDTVRESMRRIIPPGWQPSIYDIIPGLSLYQRCHLIGNQLGGAETEENLITGTQYLNIEGMLPIENQIAKYIRATGNRVLYSVWPYYGVGNYICYGVRIEAKSVEDDGILINRYCFNVQPGISIDYRTGLSHLNSTIAHTLNEPAEITYVLNVGTKRFHLPTCPSCQDMKQKNRLETTLSRDELVDLGYKPCGQCNP